MSTTTAKSYHKGNVREDLRKYAERILTEEGLEALSLRRIAREVGVAPSAVYNHFENRKALLASLAAEGFSQLYKTQKDAFAEHDDFEEGIRNLSREYLRFANRNPNLYRLMFSMEVKGRERFPELLRTGDDTFALSVNWWYGDGAHDPKKSSSEYHIPLTMWAASHGLALLVIDRQVTLSTYNDETVGMLSDKMMDILMEGMRDFIPAK